ncbi:PKD domain-containing protein [Methanoregula sp.]|uniref:PKD domain-containing protein n=1 Tax=Methanoregula sp. TaxID=2052170 RepID=UPI002630B4C3|nr:PKD domain-containing protein [Methanoregula sp.]
MKQTVWLFLFLAAGLLILPAVAGASAPDASLTANITSGGIPLSVKFIDTSTNSPSTWTWSFGDGGTSTEEDPVHTYTSAGTYTVTLTVINSDGSDTTTKSGYITLSKSASSPSATFIANITSGTQPLAVQFVDASTNSPSTWAWSFGDGGTSTSQNPTHTYTSTGSFTVTLTAVNTAGSSTVSKEAYITVSSTSSSPGASFTSTETSGSCPLTIQFIDTSSNSPNSWVWSFGDGGTSTLQNPSHKYVTSGTYTVTMTATNSGGSDTDTETDYITVDETEPISTFKTNVTSGPVPMAVQFNDTSLNSPTSWYWYFGDGGTSTEQNPVNTYTAEGTYTVVFTATNSEGSNTTSIADYINVTAVTPPTPSFTADVMTGTAPLTVQFTDTTTHSPTSWEWSFGDGDTSTLQNPKHRYTSVGTYTVSLIASNAGGSRTITTSSFIIVMSDGSTSATMTGTPAPAATEAAMQQPPAAVTPEVTATSEASSQGESSNIFVIVGVVILVGVGALGFLRMRRPPQGQVHSHRKDL